MEHHLESLQKTARDSIEVVFQIAQEELLSLLDQHEQLTARITTVKQSLVALAKLFGDELLRSDVIDRKVLAVIEPQRKRRGTGLTFATRRVLFESKNQLTTGDVYRLLLSQFPESVQHHKTPKSAITTVLKRLTLYGEVIETRNSQNVRVWESRNGEQSLGAHTGI